jgi:hypothetical protein
MKRLLSLLFVTLLFLTAQGQERQSEYIPVSQYWKEHNILQHLDVSITLGTTGVGFDLASPIGDYLQVRAGYAFMPHFHHNMTFGVQVGEVNDDATFNRLSSLMESFTGYRADNKIEMIGEPTFNNAKFLVDVFPFKNNKHWHFTAGVYWGPSQVAEAYNRTEDMPSLLAVGIYNYLFEKAIIREPLVSIDFTGNGQGFYFPDDPEIKDEIKDAFLFYGRMGVRVGNHVSDGSPYLMEPDENSMVKAKVKSNALKPYLGFGYGGRLFKNNDSYKVSFDCGAMFWGGTPSILTHDGTDLTKDVRDIGGKVGTYVNLIKKVKVFPVLNVRFTKTIF